MCFSTALYLVRIIDYQPISVKSSQEVPVSKFRPTILLPGLCQSFIPAGGITPGRDRNDKYPAKSTRFIVKTLSKTPFFLTKVKRIPV